MNFGIYFPPKPHASISSLIAHISMRVIYASSSIITFLLLLLLMKKHPLPVLSHILVACERQLSHTYIQTDELRVAHTREYTGTQRTLGNMCHVLSILCAAPNARTAQQLVRQERDDPKLTTANGLMKIDNFPCCRPFDGRIFLNTFTGMRNPIWRTLDAQCEKIQSIRKTDARSPF